VNSIFHYYTTHLLAQRSGFCPEDSQILAYSSTYVDSNVAPLRLTLPSGIEYSTIPTHHFGFWDPSQEDEVWIPFHFFPGGSEGINPEISTPNSAPVKELLVEALKSRDLFRIGIALHTYADSWAHQGFIGRSSPLNVIVPHSPIPPIGHAQVGSLPDQWNSTWNDPRLETGPVINRVRFLEAAKMIYRYLCTFNRRSFTDEVFVLSELEKVLGDSDRNLGPLKSDEEMALDFQILLGVVPYNRGDWRSTVVGKKDEEQTDKSEKQRDFVDWIKNETLYRTALSRPRRFAVDQNFEETNYYKWMEGAKTQLESGKRILRNL
jgi:hypothetical protein